VERCFGAALRPMCCVSATMHLPLPRAAVAAADIAAARREARDLRFNPQRYITAASTETLQRRSELVRRSEELRARQVRDHGERRVVFRELRHLNEQILQADPWRAAAADQRIAQLELQAVANRIALDREYFFAFHTPAELHGLRAAVRNGLGLSSVGAGTPAPA
jgi:hypothetical protein